MPWHLAQLALRVSAALKGCPVVLALQPHCKVRATPSLQLRVQSMPLMGLDKLGQCSDT